MQRRTLLVALAGLALVVAAAVVLVLPRPSQVKWENINRIQKGMTRAEVEAILGPPGDYRTRFGQTADGSGEEDGWIPDPDEYSPAIATWHDGAGENPFGKFAGEATWVGDTVVVLVVIDDTGRVLETDTVERRRLGGTILSLFWRAKRLWHRWFP
jgi:hypothetical protein